jgi:hypothetical protein
MQRTLEPSGRPDPRVSVRLVEFRAPERLTRTARLVVLTTLLLLSGCAALRTAPPSASSGSSPPPVPTGVTAPAAIPPAPPSAPAPTVALPAAIPEREPATESVAPAIAAPAGQAAGKPAPPVAKAPARPAAPAAQPPRKESVAPEAVTPKAPPLDLAALEQRLKDTKAIGVLTKITLKNQVDDLLDQFRAYYQGKLRTDLASLRRSYDLLVLKVLSLLQDGDQALATAIAASREAIWGILSDPVKFATI